MPRERVSITVDRDLVRTARGLQTWPTDGSMFDAALETLLIARRASAIDDAYRVHDRLPLNEPDEWVDLQSFREPAVPS